MRANLFCVLIALLLANVIPASAEPAPGAAPDASITAAQAPLRSEPGGNEAAIIHGGAPVRIIEGRGDWTRISVEGWVRSDQVKAGAPAKGKNAAVADPIVLVDFSIDVLSKLVTGTKRAVKLTLNLRNDSTRPIGRWKGIMLIQEKLIQGLTGDVLMRVPVSDDKPIPAGGSFNSEYFWYEDQGPFQILSPRTKKTVSIVLVEVKAE